MGLPDESGPRKVGAAFGIGAAEVAQRNAAAARDLRGSAAHEPWRLDFGHEVSVREWSYEMMRKAVVVFGVIVLVACEAGRPPTAQTAARGSSGAIDRADPAAQVNGLADKLLAHMRETSPYVRLVSGLPITQLDDMTPEYAQREAQFSRDMLARLDAVKIAELPHDQWLLAQMLRHTFASAADGDKDYWLDPVVTPYAGGLRIQTVHRILLAQQLKTQQDLDNYLRLLANYGVMLDQIAAKVRGQAERGIRVPKPAIPGVRALLEGLRTAVPSAAAVSNQRLDAFSPEQRASLQNAVAKHVVEHVVPAYGRILAIFDGAYFEKAPEIVGLSQYPGGEDYYLRRITRETGLQLTPQEIHDRGLAAVAELERKMQAIRAQVGFKGSREAFHDMLRKDPRFLAKTPSEVEQRYLTYIARIEPLIPKYFSKLPKARYGVKRLDPAAEPGMTYGYYQQPTPSDPVGYYNYNGSNLDQRPLVTAASIIYHELIPGHHFHVALQSENKDVHPVREFLFYGAFTEGWAEYASSLAEEMGILEDPYDRYGQLLSQAFLAARLVVDTGMNYFGWPLEKARRYMRDHSFESDVQIASESLRYSTDLYAQALGYRLGYEKFWELRRRSQDALGERFDIREFHTAVLGSGAMPLNVLDEHIDWFIAQQRATR